MTKNYLTKLLFTSFCIFHYCTFSPIHAQIIEWENCDKFLGNISQYSNSNDWTTYWNQVTSENGGKWGSVEGTRDVMNWTNLDLAYNLAKDNGLTFKQHVFVWGSQQPSWIETLTEEEQLAEIEEWIMEYCERYPDTDWIEVVNEPLHAAPVGSGKGDYAAALGGSGTTGWDWIIKAFELAKEHCPNAKLMINEYNLLNSSSNRSKYMNIVELLNDRNLIDAVGAQGHAFTVNHQSAADLKNAIDELASAGLPVYVTELDIDSNSASDQPISASQSEHENVQLERYQEIFPAIWEHPAIAGVTLWGYKEGTMWREEAYLVKSNGTNRKAFDWLLDYITPYNTGCEGFDPPLSIDNSKHQFELYPNPTTNGQINIKSEKSMRSIVVRNISGQIVFREQLNDQLLETQIQLALQPGIYIIKIQGDNLNQEKRIVIQ